MVMVTIKGSCSLYDLFDWIFKLPFMTFQTQGSIQPATYMDVVTINVPINIDKIGKGRLEKTEGTPDLM